MAFCVWRCIQPASKGEALKITFFVVKHGYAISLSWIDAATLQVECHECEAKEVIAKNEKVGPVTISFDLPK